MKLGDVDYDLPAELIAQEPLARRDASRLLHLAGDGTITHSEFRRLPELLEPGDLVVVNDTKVFPARLLGRRATGGVVEVLLLDALGGDRWRVLAKPARKLRPGEVIRFGDGQLRAELLEREPLVVHFDYEGAWDDVIDGLGRTPLPPYIDSQAGESETRRRYQTVYAASRGSIAAPTAGLHFTPELLAALAAKGIERAALTLHVGYATFTPMRSDEVADHRMGVERYRIPPETARRIETARRVVAVGTTTVRALESAARVDFASGWHETELFITPGFDFRVVSGLVTNFHLPRSTLLLLVCALAGTREVLDAYRQAVEERYRFYSYGDAMLIDPAGHGVSARAGGARAGGDV